MRAFLTYLACFALPLSAMAQAYSNAPLIVHSGHAAQAQPQVAEAAHAVTLGTPATPATPQPAPLPVTPAAPLAPAAPEAPPTKLWPRDTAAIFVTSCSKLRSQSIAPCRCIINRLMNQMLHDEFVKLSEADMIVSDPRYMTIREECTAAYQPQPQ